jgi:flavin reductase (DIM6/NTAB) family NADH-FMN oxidoreductase RutF
MRRLAATVVIVTSRDEHHQPHGMVASSVIPVSMNPPSMLVAVNRECGLHSVLHHAQRFCVNLLADSQRHLLPPFSQTAQRPQRFQSDDWRDAWTHDAERLPWLPSAPAVIECVVEMATNYGTHTLFIGRVLHVRCSTASAFPAPMIWLAGQPCTLQARAELTAPTVL